MAGKPRRFEDLDNFYLFNSNTTTTREPLSSSIKEPITEYNPDLSDNENDLAEEWLYPNPLPEPASITGDLSPPPTEYPDDTLRYFKTKEFGL
jgi:hypothetical protein